MNHFYFPAKVTSILLILSSCALTPPNPEDVNAGKTSFQFENEIIYHVFLRSFYDSNNDGHGDLSGLAQKLDYLQELGVTTLMLTPLYASPFYHNYFPDDFEKFDPAYGNLDTYLSFVNEVHQRDMKLIMDMEIHYITYEHPWFIDSYANPSSEYSKHIIYNGPGNTRPESIIFGLDTVLTWDGKTKGLCSIDLYNADVQRYMQELFAYWMDPNGDGDFRDGVDGFRIDHMMDDMDWKGIRPELLNNFWRPLLTNLRELNPDIFVLGEQAEWDYGTRYFQDGLADAVFAFPLHGALSALNKQQITARTDSTWLLTPENIGQVIFIENHDLDRAATIFDRNPGKLRVSAALNLLLKGIPSIYYGQEIGMPGKKQKFDESASSDIPRREAFEWYRDISGPGMALWYKGDFPWWHQTNLKSGDGISLEEQVADRQSLWHFYKRLIAIRKSTPAIRTGKIEFVTNDQPNVLSFLRSNDDQQVIVVINLDQAPVTVHLKPPSRSGSDLSGSYLNLLEDKARITIGQDNAARIELSGFDIKILERS